MRAFARRGVSLAKITRYAIVINALQITAALLVALYALFGKGFNLSGSLEKALVGVTSLVVIWGAVLDIREAYSAREITRQRQMLEEAYAQLETLNSTLRAQRHDFMNHIQVIYSLTELDDHKSALEYMDRVYGDIQKVSRALKTSIPAVNALLAAKMADCEERGITFAADIRSPWRDMPVPGWEMCRVLGNLLDNAIDAVGAEGDRRITVRLGEDLRKFTFSVENTGAPVPESLVEKIFQLGFSTKRSGRGMGLHIVREIMENYGGSINLDADGGVTRFSGDIPRKAPSEQP